FVTLAGLLGFWASAASGGTEPPLADEGGTTPTSGGYRFRRGRRPKPAACPRVTACGGGGGTTLTECPQAGLQGNNPQPLDKRSLDATERKSNGGSDTRVNQDYSCMPQDETALDVHPQATRNIIGGANDYRLGWGTSGFYASTDNGKTWYDGITP